jgi:uncharacterized protein (DUF427 family)
MRVRINNVIVADAPDDQLVRIEGNAYFPPSAITPGTLGESPTPYTCPWKGVCQYHDATVEGVKVPDAAWSYPEPYPGAVDRVGRDFAGYVAFDTRLAELLDD